MEAPLLPTWGYPGYMVGTEQCPVYGPWGSVPDTPQFPGTLQEACGDSKSRSTSVGRSPLANTFDQ